MTMHKFRIINPKASQKAISEAEGKGSDFAVFGPEDIEILPFELVPPKEYEFPINSDTNKKFPNCCGFHSMVKDHVDKWFELFPNCCDEHRKLKGKIWFDKKVYTNIGYKVVTTLSYTEHIVEDSINKNEWYKLITDYIELAINSFGSLPLGFGNAVGLHSYIPNLEHFLKHETTGIPQKKLSELLEYIAKYKGVAKSKSTSDLVALELIYKKWLKAFPFDMKPFDRVKQKFEGRMPIFSGQGETNTYTGVTKYRARTQKELIESLISTTKRLLAAVDFTKLLDVENSKVHEIELINEAHRMKQFVLLKDYSDDESKYLKILKRWFKNEKEYVRELVSLIGISKDPSPVKGFEEYLQHPRRKELAKALKKEFQVEKGKAIKLLIIALENVEPSILSTKNRSMTALYKAMKKYFGRHIGSYQSINDYKYDPIIDKQDLSDIDQRVKSIFVTLEKKK